MNGLANWITENPYWTAAGLLATFLGLIVAIITPIIQRRRKNLCFSYSNTPLVKEDVTNINGIEIFFTVILLSNCLYLLSIYGMVVTR